MIHNEKIKLVCITIVAFCLSAAISAVVIPKLSTIHASDKQTRIEVVSARSPSSYASDDLFTDERLRRALDLELREDYTTATSFYKEFLDRADFHEPETRTAASRCIQLLRRLGRSAEADELVQKLSLRSLRRQF